MSGWIRRLASALTGLLATLLLGGCGAGGQEALLADYVARLARVTDAGAALPEPRSGPAYPARRALRLDIPTRTIDVAEFFELHGCDMGALVGFRNSPLGRLQAASQRLGYEVAWLRAVERCEGTEPWLETLRAEKRTALPALFWNATFAADELRVALGGSGSEPADDLADLLRGLNDALTGVLDGGFDLSALEMLLGRLRQGSWVGPARRDWALWRRHLAAASALLEQASPGICLNRRPNTDTGRLQNVFGRFYIDRIQPELARRMRRHEAWIAELERLSGRLAEVRPAAFEAWFDAVLSPAAVNSEWRRTRRAVVDHAAAWQALFEFCGIEPVSGLGQD